MIVADDDGVVIVPRETTREAVKAAQARAEKEEASRSRFARGELGLDSYGLREQLPSFGIRYVDYTTGEPS